LRADVAELGTRQVQAEAERTRLSVEGQATFAYLDLLLVRDRLALLDRLEALWAQSEALVRARYESGAGAQSDLLRAQLERSRLRQRRTGLTAEERQALIAPQLPAGVKTELGPDATSVGWVFQYALVDRSGKHGSDELRSVQDWFLRYAVQSVPGVAEVATVGGQVRQYQVNVDLSKLASKLLVGTYQAEERHPISRLLHRLYEAPCRFVVRHAWATVIVSLVVVSATIPVYFKLGSEFMPPLGEGTLLYMPSVVQAGISAAEAEKALQVQDKLLMTFPEIELQSRPGHARRAVLGRGRDLVALPAWLQRFHRGVGGPHRAHGSRR
jgi:hypothetical protein